MTLQTNDERKPGEIRHEAGYWVGIMADEANVTETQRAAFEQWLMTSPQHVGHYLAAIGSGPAASLRAVQEAVVDEMLQRLRRAIAAEDDLECRDRTEQVEEGAPVGVLDVDSAQAATSCSPITTKARWRFPYPRSLAAAAVIAVAGVALLAELGPQRAAGVDYRSTSAGQHVLLGDGSAVKMHAETHLITNFDETNRDVELVSGGAIFSVVPDSGRPFRVRNATSTTEALGTRFGVDLVGRETRVTVLEGLVRVTGAAQSVDLVGGEETLVTATGEVEQPRSMNASSASDDESGPLLRGVKLGELACVFNARKHLPRIIVEGTARDRLVTVALPLDNPSAFIRVLKQDTTLKVKRRREGVVVRDADDPSPTGVVSTSDDCSSYALVAPKATTEPSNSSAEHPQSVTPADNDPPQTRAIE